MGLVVTEIHPHIDSGQAKRVLTYWEKWGNHDYSKINVSIVPMENYTGQRIERVKVYANNGLHCMKQEKVDKDRSILIQIYLNNGRPSLALAKTDSGTKFFK